MKGLERRYPQVCPKCEPKVQERIRAAGYAARTDHLRRMMDRTRERGIQYRHSKWGSSLVTLGGVGWFLSMAGQVLWDGISLLESTKGRHGLRDIHDSISGSEYLQRVMRGSGSVTDCTELLYSAAGLSLILGILTSWWNPILRRTLNRQGVRAAGAAEFYQLQGMLLILRCATWWYLPGYNLDAQKTTAVHVFLLVLAVFVSVQIADMEFKANTIPDEHHLFSLHQVGLFSSNQISGQSHTFGTAEHSAESVRRGFRGFWFHRSKAESTYQSQQWWYTTVFYHGLGTIKSAKSTSLPTTYTTTRRRRQRSYGLDSFSRKPNPPSTNVVSHCQCRVPTAKANFISRKPFGGGVDPIY